MSKVLAVLVFSLFLSACFFGENEIKETCDEPQAYQAAEEGKRIEVPEDLDPLDAFKEMPIPEAANSEPRPAGSKCITTPPSIRSE